jgi:hypothetical protein
MRPEQAPPGFWRWPGDGALLIDGVELESAVPTRFFQSVDKYPAEWGRLNWRMQLNKREAERAASPMFRTFYPGVEWNLNVPDYAWFMTAWFAWEGPGPPYPEPSLPRAASVEGDTVLFRIGWMQKADGDPAPDLDRPLFLRSRVDARDRRRVAEDRRAQSEPRANAGSATIVLDDIVAPPE